MDSGEKLVENYTTKNRKQVIQLPFTIDLNQMFRILEKCKIKTSHVLLIKTLEEGVMPIYVSDVTE